MTHKYITALLVAQIIVLVTACSGGDDSSPAPDESTTTVGEETSEHLYEATIRRTSDGVPHIVATDLPGVFFGQGYASAEDHACSLADQLLKITSTRAAFLGAGSGDTNINSDFAWKSIGINELAREDYLAVSTEITDQFEAFAAGWNSYVDEVGVDGLSGWCSGADWVRPGIALYGSAPDFPLHTASEWQLQPVMSLNAAIVGVQHLQPGDTVGYGSSYVADRAMRIGVVACGYADGYPRHAPTGTPVCVDGIRTRTVGRVSMDMITVDITDLPHADRGSEVTLWGQPQKTSQPSVGVSIDEVASAAGTVGYELMCALAARVPVAVLDTL